MIVPCSHHSTIYDPEAMKPAYLITNCSIISKNDTDTSSEQRYTIKENQFIQTEDDTIRATGPMEELCLDQKDLLTIDGKNKLAMPGLINAHNHCAMTLFRGLADDLELHDWLEHHIFPAEATHVTAEMVYWCSKLAAAEMLLSGTTCVADGYFLCNQTAQAFEDAGIRAIVAHGILDFPTPGVTDPHENLHTVATFLHQWKERSERVMPAVFAHSPYTCSPETLVQAKRLADKESVRFFIHLAETKQESQMLMDPQGPTPVQHLAALGILDSNCVCIHAIWLNEHDMDIIKETGAHIVFCPQSNYKLASGISHAEKLQRKGIHCGLGTDGCASNNSLDMFREMGIFAKSHKGFSLSPTIFPAQQVLTMAWEDNNALLGFSDSTSLTAGNRADIVLLDINRPHLTPLYNPDILVYGAQAGDVDTVFVAGHLVVKERKILSFDLEEVKERVRNLAKPLQKNAAEISSPQESHAHLAMDVRKHSIY